MAATQATTGFGTKLRMSNSPVTDPTLDIPEIRSIGGPTRSMNFADATHMESPNGYDEFLPTFKSGGSVPIEMNYLPADAGQLELQVAYEAREKRKFWVIYPSGTRRCAFEAYVENLNDTQPHNDVMRRSVQLKITGAVTFSAHP